LPEFSLADASVRTVTDANQGTDAMTTAHMKNWMECIRSRKEPNAPIEAGYNHSVASLMVTESLLRGRKVLFDEKKQEIVNE
jgi:hypothetical protein